MCETNLSTIFNDGKSAYGKLLSTAGIAVIELGEDDDGSASMFPVCQSVH